MPPLKGEVSPAFAPVTEGFGVAICSFSNFLEYRVFLMRIATPVTSVTHYKFLVMKEP